MAGRLRAYARVDGRQIADRDRPYGAIGRRKCQTRRDPSTGDGRPPPRLDHVHLPSHLTTSHLTTSHLTVADRPLRGPASSSVLSWPSQQLDRLPGGGDTYITHRPLPRCPRTPARSPECQAAAPDS